MLYIPKPELFWQKNEQSKSMFVLSSPSTVHHKDAMRNCAMSMDQIQEYRCPLSPVGEAPLSPAYSSSESTHTLMLVSEYLITTLILI